MRRSWLLMGLQTSDRMNWFGDESTQLSNCSKSCDEQEHHRDGMNRKMFEAKATVDVHIRFE